MTLHNLGENDVLGVKTDLFGHPLPFHPQFAHKTPAKSDSYTLVGEMGEMGEFTRHRVGEMGESPRGLTHSPMLAHPDQIVAPVKQGVVSKQHQSDTALADWARSFRKRFGDKLTLKRRTAYDDQCEGMVSGLAVRHESGGGV